MIYAIENRITGETLAIELEIGPSWWVRDRNGLVIEAARDQFPPERWRYVAEEGAQR